MHRKLLKINKEFKNPNLNTNSPQQEITIRKINFVSFTGTIMVANMKPFINFDSLPGTAAHSGITFY